MLVRLVEYNYKDEQDKLENPKFIRGTHIGDYSTFLSMLQHMKGKDIKVGDDWYTFEGDYVLNFPESDDHIMCLDIYVVSY